MPKPARIQLLLPPLLLLLLTVTAYWGVWRHNFINLDDPMYVQKSPYVLKGITTESVRWALGANLLFPARNADYWIPLTYLSHMLDVEWFGPDPGAHHAVNLALHALNVILFAALFGRLTGRPWTAALAALMLAVHPIHVEAVVWITARKDVLSALFWLLTLSAYGLYCERPGRSRYILVVVLYAMALTTKPMVVTLPCVLLLLDVWPLRRIDPAALGPGRAWPALRKPVVEKLPLFAMSVLISLLTLAVESPKGSIVSSDIMPFGRRLVSAVVNYAEYLRNLAWPIDLAVIYPYGHEVRAWQVVVAAGMLTAVSAACLVVGRRLPYLAVGWLWFLGVLFPVCGLAIQVGQQSVADRFVYIPFMGLYIALAFGLADLTARCRAGRILRLAIAACLALLMGVLTRKQVGRWQDSETLFAHTLRVTTRNHLAHYCLGAAKHANGDVTGAIAEFQEALRIAPDKADVHNNLGVAYRQAGRNAEAEACFREALRLAPRHPMAWCNLADLLASTGHMEAAVRCYRELFVAVPDYTPRECRDGVAPEHLREAHRRLGQALLRLGQIEAAVPELRRALDAKPDDWATRNDLGYALHRLNRHAEAITELERSARLAPNEPGVQDNLGRSLFAVGRFADAAAAFRRAVECGAEGVDLLVNAGMACMGKGDAAEALLWYESALAKAPGNPDVQRLAAEALTRLRRGQEAAERFGDAPSQKP